MHTARQAFPVDFRNKLRPLAQCHVIFYDWIWFHPALLLAALLWLPQTGHHSPLEAERYIIVSY
jgi:hypothetical protein